MIHFPYLLVINNIYFVNVASENRNYGMEELNNLDLKSRFTVFERSPSNPQDDAEFKEDHKFVKRSESILSKLAKYV